jgi:hypothetical protein
VEKTFDNPQLDELTLRKEWLEEARQMTVERLPAFVEKLVNHQHDYGTICRAIAAAGVAAAYAVERSPAGGITGFQAGCVLWDLITGWNESYEGKPVRLINYNEMLYPQYRDKFRSISQQTWEGLQKEAQKRLQEDDQGMHPRVSAHMRDIVNGFVPFGYEIRD